MKLCTGAGHLLLICTVAVAQSVKKDLTFQDDVIEREVPYPDQNPISYSSHFKSTHASPLIQSSVPSTRSSHIPSTGSSNIPSTGSSHIPSSHSSQIPLTDSSTRTQSPTFIPSSLSPPSIHSSNYPSTKNPTRNPFISDSNFKPSSNFPPVAESSIAHDSSIILTNIPHKNYQNEDPLIYEQDEYSPNNNLENHVSSSHDPSYTPSPHPPTQRLTPPPPNHPISGNAVDDLSSTENATISYEEFNSILTRFSLDALEAVQMAERLDLVGPEAEQELQSMMELGGHFHAEGDPNDNPRAMAFGSEGRKGTVTTRSTRRGISHATRRFFLGDQSLCFSGTCEFFLMCWLGGGLIEGGCGGFLFACCHKSGRSHSSDAFREVSIPINYGQVRNDPGCGLSAEGRISAQRRVVGGSEAGFGSFPWQAYIRIGSSRCGGSLINQYHVVTAGHCVARARASQIRVTLGDYILNSNQEPLSHKVYTASDIKVHPRFKFTPQADRFDVAVIRLKVPVEYQPHIQPICLPEKGRDWLGYYGWAAGWGALKAGSRLRPKTLQVVDVPVIDSQQCEHWHKQKGINVIIYDEMMCAGYRDGGKDSCQGDSGGPLMIQDSGRWYLAGIVSAGYACAKPKQPGIYHRVSYTSDWISWAAS